MDKQDADMTDRDTRSHDVSIVRRETTRRSMLKLGLVAASLPLVMTLTAHEAKAQASYAPST